MDKQESAFDIHQGHGDHLDCIREDQETGAFLTNWLPRILAKGDIVATTSDPVAHNLGGAFPEKTLVFLIGYPHPPLRVVAMIAANAEKKQNTLISAYPEYDGAEVPVRLTAIHEWANGLEATLEGSVLGEERDIAFFDTRYPCSKHRYKLGETYRFQLAAFAYSARFLEENEKILRMVGKEAEDWYERVGKAINWQAEFDEKGHLKPIEIRMDGMVAFFCGPKAYPDDCDFQSPVFAIGDPISEFGVDFIRFDIAIARDAEDVVVPLIARKALLPRLPSLEEPIRGRCWLQGHCLGESKPV